MRVNTPTATPAVAETKSAAVTAEVKPAVAAEVKSAIAPAAKPAVGFKKDDAFLSDIGIIRPGPYPMPPINLGDAKTRATQANQLDQIARGVRNGSITAQEAEKLLAEQAKIADYQKQAMADGFMSQEERLKLGVMQSTAALSTFQAANNGDRNAFAGLDRNAQRQADQISRLADGRRSGNVTNTEAGELLRDQVEIADARGDADSAGEFAALNGKLNAADKEIAYHSRPGTQHHFKPLPWPQPIPMPTPLPLPQPIPMPAPLPFPGPLTVQPAKPELQPLPFRGVING
ncbi:MAG TPA: hypothetical protein VNA24_00225 [Hyalangium sp.]|jgi:hypothetical protein|nr:hypothetical protein [Hyalangium sp.]